MSVTGGLEDPNGFTGAILKVSSLCQRILARVIPKKFRRGRSFVSSSLVCHALNFSLE